MILLVVAATQREVDGVRVGSFVCGIGPIDAGIATARALVDGPRPDAILHVGVAGARVLEPATLVIGSESIYEDGAGPLVAGRIEPDAELLAAARRALPAARVLPIGTSARVGGASACAVEAMEGFSVLRAAALAGIPAVELRAVSNAVDEADRSRWRIDEAIAALHDAIPRVLAELER